MARCLQAAGLPIRGKRLAPRPERFILLKERQEFVNHQGLIGAIPAHEGDQTGKQCSKMAVLRPWTKTFAKKFRTIAASYDNYEKNKLPLT